MKLEAKILDDRLKPLLPSYATPGSAAIDLRACSTIDGDGASTPLTTIHCIGAGATVKVGTGLAVHIGSLEIYGDPLHGDPNFSAAGFILPRSGLGADKGIVVGNLVGLIDADYQGELIVALWNRSTKPFILAPLDRIAQIVFLPVLKPGFDVLPEFSASTERGAGGFGSTGG